MKTKNPVDELSQVRMAIKALRLHESELVDTLLKDAGCGKHIGDTATVAISERRKRVIDESALPPEIINNRKYWRSERTHRCKVTHNDDGQDIPDPSVVFKGDIVAVARRWAVDPV